VAQPGLAGLFERIGIDDGCGGQRTFAHACAAKDLDPRTFAALREAPTKLPAGGSVVDAGTMPLTALADHIEPTHQHYLNEELRALVEKAGCVAPKHGRRDARLAPVAETRRALAEEMMTLMAKAEQILFPLVRALAPTGTVSGHGGPIANLIPQRERAHAGAGAAVARLRELTDGFTPDVEACTTHRAMLAGYARFETDLHARGHQENNVLFPRALEVSAAA